MPSRARVLIAGRVQGVFFRAHTQRKAQELGLAGFVRNLADGRVEVTVEGWEESIQQLVAWCRRGPSEARVERVEVEWEDFRGEFQSFTILRS
jgi:acylphosphatase